MANEKDKNRTGKIPENNPSKAMDSKKEVEQSPDEKTDQDFPGYPHYPAKEDIMDQRTDTHRVDMDVENIPNSRNVSGISERFVTEGQSERLKEHGTPQPDIDQDDYRDIGPRTELTRDDLKKLNTRPTSVSSPRGAEDDELRLQMGTDADVSKDEIKALEDTTYMPTADEDNLRRAHLDNTDFDGDELNEESFGERRSGSGLDIPEETDETNTEALGQGDEENKYYSLGGDRQEGNEEDPYSGPGTDRA